MEGKTNNNFFTAPPAVTNLDTDSLASDSVTLTWTRPATNCPISQYFVSYLGSVLWNDEEDQNSVTVDGTTAEYKATGLTPYTNYSFCVVANNDMRNGTAECVEDIVTLEGSNIFLFLSINSASLSYDHVFCLESQKINGSYRILRRSTDFAIFFIIEPKSLKFSRNI